MTILIIVIVVAVFIATLIIVGLKYSDSKFVYGTGLSNLPPTSSKTAKKLLTRVNKTSVYDLPSTYDIVQISKIEGQTSNTLDKELRTISKKLAVNKAALKTFFKAVRKNNIPDENISEKIIETSKKYHEIQHDLLKDEYGSAELRKTNREALEAIHKGQIKEADKKLLSIEQVFITEAKKNNSSELMFSAARKRAQRAEVSTLELNYGKAGNHYRNAHNLTPEDYREHKLGYLIRASRYFAEAKKYGEALSIAENAVAVAEDSFGKNHSFAAEALNSLANVFSLTKRYDEAIVAYQRSLAILENENGKNSISVGKTLYSLAETYVNKKAVDKAVTPFQRSLAIYENTYGSLHDKVINVLNNLVNIYRVLGRFDDAEKLLVNYILRLEAQPRSLQGAKLALVINNLGLLYMHSNRFDDARPQFTRALSLIKKTFGEDHPEVARTLNNLANLEDRLGNTDTATDLLRQSLRIVKHRYPEDHPNVILVSNNFNAVASKKKKNHPKHDSTSAII